VTNRLTLILVFILALCLSTPSGGLFDHAGSAESPKAAPGIETFYESNWDPPVRLSKRQQQISDRQVYAVGASDQAEMKRLKLMFLILISLGSNNTIRR
jgi:hypothetical protein